MSRYLYGRPTGTIARKPKAGKHLVLDTESGPVSVTQQAIRKRRQARLGKVRKRKNKNQAKALAKVKRNPRRSLGYKKKGG